MSYLPLIFSLIQEEFHHSSKIQLKKLTFASQRVLIKDIVFGSKVTGSISHLKPNYIRRNEQLLIKGVNMGNPNQCCYYFSTDNLSWLLFDFEEPKKISTVELIALNHNNKDFWLRTGDIWYGNSSTSNGDFSNFKLFESFPDFNRGSRDQSIHKREISHSSICWNQAKQSNAILYVFCCYLLIK